jgi:hypothetical protein
MNNWQWVKINHIYIAFTTEYTASFKFERGDIKFVNQNGILEEPSNKSRLPSSERLSLEKDGSDKGFSQVGF